MRTHIQGFALLGFLVLSLWGLTRVAGPALSDAFGDDGAVNAAGGDEEDTIDLTIGAEEDAPLTGDEVRELQFGLFIEGFLPSVDEVDGIVGARTEAAMDAARERWDMVDSSDRQLYDHVVELVDENPFFSEAP